jgi:predicted PurR-regulated permease PerM
MDKQEISISTGTFVRIIVIGAVAYMLWILRSLVLLVLTAIVIASAIEPGVEWFAKWKMPRVLSVLVMYLLVFGSLFGFIYFFVPPILDDAQGFIASVPQYLDTIPLPSSFSGLADVAHQVSSGETSGSAFDTLVAFREAFSSDTSQGAIRTLSAVFGGIFSFGLVVVLSFYFAIQETGVEDFLRLVTPKKREDYVVGLWLRAKKKIGLWMQGQLLSSLLGGTIIYLGLLLIGVPYSFALALFAAVAMLVPIFGSIVAAVVPILVAFSAGGFSMVLLTAGLFLVVNQFEAHLIHPLVVNKVVGVPPLLVILALIAGGELAGFLGVLLSVPLAATLREFLNDVERGKKARA